MRIEEITIRNYRSLRSVVLRPHNLNVLVGANGSGKSNLADGLDFISEVYRHGLEFAVTRKGGYENIAHTKRKRARSITIEVRASLDVSPTASVYEEVRAPKETFPLRVDHSFTFATAGSAIRAAFSIVRESLTVSCLLGPSWVQLIHARRSRVDPVVVTTANAEDLRENAEMFGYEISDGAISFLSMRDMSFLLQNTNFLRSNELFLVGVGRFAGPLWKFIQGLSGIRVYQINPTTSRQSGVPTPAPELTRSGDNLPAAVDLLQKSFPDRWDDVMMAMQRIVPVLENISVGYTSSRTLGLFFHEAGFGRPWTVGEISDGTVQALALLVAIYDPRWTALVIEEPENSVHPWIIRSLIDACRDAAGDKQILVTTHSPVVINAVDAGQVWVMWRSNGESQIAPLVSLRPSFRQQWELGQLATFDLIDSGAVKETIPPRQLWDTEDPERSEPEE